VITEVPFPEIPNTTGSQGVVGTWFVAHGENVAAGQVIAEVQIDKVSVDVAAPVAGVMYQLIAESVAISPGDPMARIDS
jgi:pyruvate/2-oxoglutarate dehydrogenase complex dihydrolipoamide acyltransferase (E2) component